MDFEAKDKVYSLSKESVNARLRVSSSGENRSDLI